MYPLRMIKNFFQWLLTPFHWLFVRLPKGFTIPLIIITLMYFILVFPWLVYEFIPKCLVEPVVKLLALIPPKLLIALSVRNSIAWGAAERIAEGLVIVGIVVSALLTIGFMLGGVLLSYWLAAKFYYGSRHVMANKVVAPTPVIPAQTSDEDMDEQNPLAKFKRIGIILSGGGAKGAYQAGALKAIYEFLKEHKAHHKVQMIAATSIGAWNSLFWLADLVDGPDGGPMRKWWSTVNVQNLILPVRYVPMLQNYLLSNEPWVDSFNAIFKDTYAGERLLYHLKNPDAPDAMRFYFTRSNIIKANLAYTTNHQDVTQVQANLPKGRPRPVVPEGTCYIAKNLDDIRKGVFASMDIPPLFQYTSDDSGDFYEDGGVIDNLPIRFGTEIEECDLLFILPLNASFEREVNHRSLIKRLARVTEIRQGVLERNSFKMIYLYNELAGLRKRIAELEDSMQPVAQTSTATDRKEMAEEKIAEQALMRNHNIVHVFSICPAPELLISTTEFWKTKEAERAFDFMYEATKKELEKFDRLVNSAQIHMVCVGPNEPKSSASEVFAYANKSPYKVTYFKDF